MYDSRYFYIDRKEKSTDRMSCVNESIRTRGAYDQLVETTVAQQHALVKCCLERAARICGTHIQHNKSSFERAVQNAETEYGNAQTSEEYNERCDDLQDAAQGRIILDCIRVALMDQEFWNEPNQQYQVQVATDDILQNKLLDAMQDSRSLSCIEEFMLNYLDQLIRDPTTLCEPIHNNDQTDDEQPTTNEQDQTDDEQDDDEFAHWEQLPGCQCVYCNALIQVNETWRHFVPQCPAQLMLFRTVQKMLEPYISLDTDMNVYQDEQDDNGDDDDDSVMPE